MALLVVPLEVHSHKLQGQALDLERLEEMVYVLIIAGEEEVEGDILEEMEGMVDGVEVLKYELMFV